MKTTINILLIILLLTKISTALINLEIETQISRFIKANFEKNSTISYNVIHSSGKSIYKKNINKSLIPASNQKILTTSAALLLLNEYRYSTLINYYGKVYNNNFIGVVEFVGSGDPSFASGKAGAKTRFETINDIIHFIKEKEIDTIRGNIIVNSSIFDSLKISSYETWEDMGNYYGGISTGFPYNGNEYKLYLSSSSKKKGKVRILKTEPFVTGINKFNNQLTVGKKGSGDNAYIFGSPFSTSRILRGSIPPNKRNFTIRGSLPKPDLSFISDLKKALDNAGIIYLPNNLLSINVNKNERLTLLDSDTIFSPNLISLISHLNKKSDNVFAEQLLKTIAVEFREIGSSINGLEIIDSLFSANNIPNSGIRLKDGSGLSFYNLLTTNYIAKIFLLIKNKGNYKDFFLSLPNSSISSELRTYTFFNKNYKVLAKTGSLDGVIALSGSIEIDNKIIFFSFISNHHLKSNKILRNKISQLIKLTVNLYRKQIGN